MPRYDVYLRVSLLNIVPKGGASRYEIFKFIDGLQERPNTPGDFVEYDVSRRELQVKLIGGYAVSYWVDEPAKVVMIANVEAAD